MRALLPIYRTLVLLTIGYTAVQLHSANQTAAQNADRINSLETHLNSLGGKLETAAVQTRAEVRQELQTAAQTQAPAAESALHALTHTLAELQATSATLQQNTSVISHLTAATPAAAAIPAQAPEPYWISSTGKTHNSNCRYYANCDGHYSSKGSGDNCKYCGGSDNN